MHEIAAKAGDLALGIGLFTALLTVVDLLLSQKQKDFLAHCSVRIWFFTDQFLGKSLSIWPGRSKTANYLLFLTIVLVALFAGFTFGNRNKTPDESIFKLWEILAVIVLPSSLIGFVILKYIIGAATPLWALVRATICLLIIPVPLGLVVIYANLNKENLIPHGQANLTQLLYVITFISSILSTTVVVLFWLVIAIPVAVIFVLITLLTFLEFVARRVAEASKGPLLALAALLAVVGAAAKLI